MAVTCALLVGCNTASQPASSDQEKSSAKGKDMQPKLSLHKPKTFPNAITRLKQMHEALLEDGEFPAPTTVHYVEVIHGTGASGHSHYYSAADYEANKGEGEEDHDHYPGEHDHEEHETVKQRSMEVDLRTELTDVVRWLPDIAAKSDLNETAWNSVDSISGRLTEIINAIEADAADDSFRATWKLKSKEIDSMLGELQSHVATSSGESK